MASSHKMNSREVREKRASLMYRDGPGCVFCGWEEGLTIDHIVKRADGGTNRLENLRLLCEACHTWHHWGE